jgi:hypothetical protein
VGSGRRWGSGRRRGKGGEMTQTLYAHMNKKKKRICWFINLRKKKAKTIDFISHCFPRIFFS